MKSVNLADVQEAGLGGDQLAAGGYVCKYTSVEDFGDKQYLYMEFDIAEGEHKGYFADLEKRANFWGGKCYRSYKEKALPMFKRMCSAVSKSNPGFIFDGGKQNADEKTLVGKQVGIILGEEEYLKNNGDVGTRLYVYAECDVALIRKGDFKVPKKKTLVNDDKTTGTQQGDSIPGFLNVPDGVMESLPFN